MPKPARPVDPEKLSCLAAQAKSWPEIARAFGFYGGGSHSYVKAKVLADPVLTAAYHRGRIGAPKRIDPRRKPLPSIEVQRLAAKGLRQQDVAAALGVSLRVLTYHMARDMQLRRAWRAGVLAAGRERYARISAAFDISKAHRARNAARKAQAGPQAGQEAPQAGHEAHGQGEGPRAAPEALKAQLSRNSALGPLPLLASPEQALGGPQLPGSGPPD